jgi:tRNA(Arg) A34 adenosine deaminase TadA
MWLCVTQFILSGNCSTCFGWYFHPTSGVQTTVSTASGFCHAVIAICRYRGKVENGLSMLWVAYASHSTLSVCTGRCGWFDLYQIIFVS